MPTVSWLPGERGGKAFGDSATSSSSLTTYSGRKKKEKNSTGFFLLR